MSRYIAGIDIGSTFTKGALFLVEEERLVLLAKKSVSTTEGRLSEGFFKVHDELVEAYNRCGKAPPDTPVLPEQQEPDNRGRREQPGRLQIRFSSSAKGGLSIVAIGIIPSLTSEMAKMTALGAGAKVIKVYAYKLNRAKITEIDALRPDIVLFAGGTEGGNEEYNLHNARELKSLQSDPVIIYAGNSEVSDRIQDILRGKNIFCAENILPAIDEPSPEGAREKIRKIFLEKIVYGKGLDEIIDRVGSNPVPTPTAVISFVEAVPRYRPEWENFCIIDVGGATTDFYSSLERESCAGEGTILRGLPEPKVKRSVEGDLGVRWSVRSTVEAGQNLIERLIAPAEKDAFERYITKIDADHAYLPRNREEKEFDSVLAELCFILAERRHAGTLRTVYTPHGPVSVQTGRDLRKVQRIVGTGGLLSGKFTPRSYELDRITAVNEGLPSREVLLLSESADYYRDVEYLIPILGTIVPDYPKQAVNIGITAFEKGPVSRKTASTRMGAE